MICGFLGYTDLVPCNMHTTLILIIFIQICSDQLICQASGPALEVPVKRQTSKVSGIQSIQKFQLVHSLKLRVRTWK